MKPTAAINDVDSPRIIWMLISATKRMLLGRAKLSCFQNGFPLVSFELLVNKVPNILVDNLSSKSIAPCAKLRRMKSRRLVSSACITRKTMADELTSTFNSTWESPGWRKSILCAAKGTMTQILGAGTKLWSLCRFEMLYHTEVSGRTRDQKWSGFQKQTELPACPSPWSFSWFFCFLRCSLLFLCQWVNCSSPAKEQRGSWVGKTSKTLR